MAQWFTIRSYKEHATEDQLPWRNEVEIQSEGFMTDEMAQGIMGSWRAFERALTFNFVNFTDATISTWQAEPEGSVQPALWQFQGAVLPGVRETPGLTMPLEHTLNLVKLPYHGQKGKLSLRGCLLTAEVLSTPRGWTLLPAARGLLNTMLADAYDTLTSAWENYGVQMGMVSYPIVGWEPKPVAPGSKPKFTPVYGDVLYERLVAGMRVGGAGKIQLRHS